MRYRMNRIHAAMHKNSIVQLCAAYYRDNEVAKEAAMQSRISAIVLRLALCVLPVSVGVPANCYADHVNPRLVLTRFESSPFGRQEPIFDTTNRCVAAIRLHEWSEAHQACDDAVAAGLQGFEHAPMGASTAQSNDLALAYTNRAVLRYLTGDVCAARQDIARAATLAPTIYAIRNDRAQFGDNIGTNSTCE
jgi:hypothetical protein